MGSCDSARASSAVAAGGSIPCCPCHPLAQRPTRLTTTPRPPTHHNRRARNRRVLMCCVIRLYQCSENILPTDPRGLGALPCRPYKGCFVLSPNTLPKVQIAT